MTTFISILISFVFMSIADSIDSAFNNLISIDAIIVSGSFLLLDSIFRSFSEIGIYTYRATRKNEWQYLWFNIVFGIVMGVVVLLCRDFIINIFNLTPVQKEKLSTLLVFYCIHTICYSVCLTLEIITNAYQANLMIKVPEGKTYEEQYTNCMNMRKNAFP
ncbi:MAG: hypothetical protein RSE00_05625 [Clostridia bacterium]